jgi:hypothetical protein
MTIEPGIDKLAQVNALLDRAASGAMRVTLEQEWSLTGIGNQMQIRHFETGKAALNDIDVLRNWKAGASWQTSPTDPRE